jgi:hypothetical protein
LLTGITQQALANLDKTLKLSLFIKAKVLLAAVTEDLFPAFYNDVSINKEKVEFRI